MIKAIARIVVLDFLGGEEKDEMAVFFIYAILVL